MMPGPGEAGDVSGAFDPVSIGELVPDVAHRAVWGVRDICFGIVSVIGLLILVEVSLGGPAALIFGSKAPETLGVEAASIALWDAGMIFIVYQLVRRKGGNWRDLGFVPLNTGMRAIDRSWGGIIAVAVPGYFAAYLTVVIYSILIKVLGLDFLEPSQQVPRDYYDHAWLLAIIGFSIVITAPLAEETFFRGFLFGGLRRRIPFFFAALISGLLFSLAHGDPGLVLPFMGVGVVLAFTYERTGSIFGSMSVHFVFNLISFLILVFVPEARK